MKRPVLKCSFSNFITVGGRYKLDSRGLLFGSRRWQKVSLFSREFRLTSGPVYPSIKWTPDFFLGKVGRGVKLTFPYRFEVMDAKNYSSVPPVCLHVVRMGFTFCVIYEQLCNCKSAGFI